MPKRGKTEEKPLARAQCAAPAREPVAADHNLWWGDSAACKRRKREEARDRPSETRCDPVRDSGRTKGGADACLFFARGCCHLGWRCDRRHAVPGRDDAEPPNELDVFGRPRDRDDGEGTHRFGRGAGDARRANRTLWLGHVAADAGAVRGDFAAFGDVVDVRSVEKKQCVFVSFATRAQAEFAKEAMDHQTLGGDPSGTLHPPGKPCLHVVRWATDDPRPAAAERTAVDASRAVLRAAGAAAAAPPEAAPAPAEEEAEAAAAALPAGWREAYDTRMGAVYFYHEDGRTAWERPEPAKTALSLLGGYDSDGS